MLVIALTLGLFVDVTPDQVLDRVQAAYRQAGDIEARFVQSYTGKLRGKKREEHGRLWAKADGRVRWQYEAPVRKYFIYDGRNAYFYEPKNAQVTVFEHFDDSELSYTLRFLLGQGDMRKRFLVKPCPKDCHAGEPGDEVIALWPKKPLGNVDHVLLVVRAMNRVRMSVVFDALGNRTDYLFTDVKFHAQIKDKKFQFKTPEGVQELRATVDGPAPAD